MNIFICNVCGHLEFETKAGGCPVCASTEFTQNDKVLEESLEKSKEGAVKHIPLVKINKDCSIIPEEPCLDIIVRIGEVLHPMTAEHFIRFIDCYIDNKYVTRVLLTPGVYPSAVIHLKESGSKVTIVENCSLHGYWLTEKDL